VVRVDGRPVGVLGIADQLRTGGAEVVTAITALTRNGPLLLTGDNPRAATALAAEVGLTDVRAGLWPQDKVDVIRALHADGQRMMLVGDGVNDAPALAVAHTGVAMGRAGSDLALDTADAVIVRDELATVPAVIARYPAAPPGWSSPTWSSPRHSSPAWSSGIWPGPCPYLWACSATKAPPSSSPPDEPAPSGAAGHTRADSFSWSVTLTGLPKIMSTRSVGSGA
jgi:soluble P-type ATPase